MTDEKDDQTAVPESSFDKFIRDEQGRFAKEDTTEPAPPAAPAPEQSAEPPAPSQPATPAPVAPAPQDAPQKPDTGHIPIAALLDEREKRKELERRLREYEEKQKTAQPVPDPIADPEGFQQHLDARMTREKQDMVFRFSEQFAARQHGAETVKSAMDWLGQELQTNPALWSTIESHSDPAEHVVQLHKRHLRAAKLGEYDPDEYARQWAEKNGYVLQQPSAQPGAPAAAHSPQPPKPPPPRPSIASAPAAAPVAAQDSAYNEAEVFKGVFGKR